MQEYVYTNVPGKIKHLLRKLREVGVPPKATRQWLTSIGFKSSNDPSLIGVLQFVQFADDSGVPTELWRSYRGADREKTLARGIKQGYAELFATYPDACSQSNEDLEHFVRSKSTKGQQVVKLTVSTFKSLCELAEFEAPPSEASTQDSSEPSAEKSSESDAPTHVCGVPRGVTININVQLSLPETTDATVYDRLFEAMKKYLMTGF
jgi:Family of unknown function (DUF5343)